MTDQSQGYAPVPAQQPKKKHTVRNVILIVLLLMVLMFGGCLALVGGAANEIDKAIQDEQKNDVPVAVTEGEGFTHDGYEVADGWSVKKEQFGGVTITGLKATNTSDDARTALLSFRFYEGSENLAEVECSSNELQGGESSALDCYSTASKFPTGYQEIKVADSF